MRINTLLERAGVKAPLKGDADVTSVVSDSRRVRPGALFVAYPGLTRESEQFLESAQEAGAVAAMVHSASGFERARQLGLTVFQVEPDGFARAAAQVAHVFHGDPTSTMRVLGVTGTNGKTTVACLVREMAESLGRKTAYLGTLGFGLGDELRPLPNTTPFAVDLVEMLAEARDAGCQLVAMEVSSHALAQDRVWGVRFDAAVFTNLTQDHLDFHGTMEAYAAEKKRLFTDYARQSEKPFVAVLNLDDATGRAWAKSLGQTRVLGFRLDGPRLGAGGDGIRATADEVRLDQITLTLEDGTWMETVEVPLGGAYNVSNAVAAFSGLLALHWERWLGEDFEASEDAFLSCAQALEAVHPVPGRFETIANTRGIGVIVDYAHTPDALEKLLDAVRPLTKGRLITVFGCGGDRDRTKRPLMAKAASERSDLTVITSDNPRTEDPSTILDEVAGGIVKGKEHKKVLDRTEAVRFAIEQAKEGDVVVVAGKGHEDYQIVGRERTHLDDRELAREALR